MERTHVSLHLELPDTTVGLIEELMAVTGVRSQKEFFHNALTLFKWAIDERRAGRQIASLDRARWLHREIHIPALDSVLVTAISPRGTGAEGGGERPD